MKILCTFHISVSGYGTLVDFIFMQLSVTSLIYPA